MQQGLLAGMYRSGYGGVENDEVQARAWFEKALPALKTLGEQGEAEAASWLYHIYTEGQWLEKNEAEALKWLRIAAAGEVAEAKYQLGLRYENGDGMPEEIEKALKLFQEATWMFTADLTVIFDTEQDIREAQEAEEAYLRVKEKLGIE